MAGCSTRCATGCRLRDGGKGSDIRLLHAFPRTTAPPRFAGRMQKWREKLQQGLVEAQESSKRCALLADAK